MRVPWTSGALVQVAGFAIAACLLYGTYDVARMAYADSLARRRSLESLLSATRLAPGNEQYWLTRAELLDHSGRDGDSALLRATQLNPDDASAWIQLGLSAEARGDFERAQHYFIRATRVSQLYRPRWVLANYYFRRESPERFWPVAKQAIERSPGDRTPMFRLCWSMSDDSDEILRKAIPARQPILRGYLGYLVTQGQDLAAETVARRLIANPERPDVEVLLAFCSRMLALQRPEVALDLWNRLCESRLLPYEALRPADGLSLTNGDFQVTSPNGAFDWRVRQVHGVSTIISAGAARIAFSGEEPEKCELLEQFLPVAPLKHYRVAFEYQTSEIRPDSGLQWEVFDNGDISPSAVSPQLSSPDWTRGTLEFSTARDTRLVRLALTYRRKIGTARIEGSLALRHMNMRYLP